MRERFRRNPVAAGYLSAVAGLALLMRFVFDDGMSAQIHESLSANTDNLADHPATALLGSAFVLDPGAGALRTALVLAAAAVCLGRFEREVGPWRAGAVAAVGHVGAALAAAAATSSGAYPTDLSAVVAVGVDDVALAAAGAVTALVPPVLRAPWLALVVTCPLIGAQWYGAVPGSEAVGHVSAAVLGAAGGALAVRRAFAGR
ncbi:rhomboid-like protein [Saccharothrix syringae]|uniref:Rhomboid family intramembrane serine protease n=1 Tax=Saccharothrix syringae TaxID=103733 RepID=A0A5Q0HA17_SACSY|nr:rhomboid-like protein [Saccharothrix syringae]QFZ22502.1 hypothetical protein EKG83_38310 [Saccharothrix syringae]